ncbi:MAG: hypothetical protein V1735_03635 [Nanoarchaeota archaeon]
MRGTFFSWLFIVITIILLGMAGLQLVKERRDVQRAVGELQAELIQHDRGIEYLESYTDAAGELSMGYAVNSWLGNGLRFDTPCSTYGDYALWLQVMAPGALDCIPRKPMPALSRHIETYANSYLQAYPATGSQRYEVSIIGGQAKGIALGKLFNPIRPEDRTIAISRLSQEEQDCIAQGKRYFSDPDTGWSACNSCRDTSCSTYLEPRSCLLDPCDVGCRWEGSSCVEGKDTRFSLDPGFNKPLGFDQGMIAQVMAVLEAFLREATECKGSLDACITDAKSRAELLLLAISPDIDWTNPESCDNPAHYLLRTFTEQIERCLYTPQPGDCSCEIVAPTTNAFPFEKIVLASEPGKTVALLYLTGDPQPVAISTLPFSLTALDVLPGQKIYLFKDRFITDQEAAAMSQCKTLDRWRRFCVRLPIKSLSYDSLNPGTDEKDLTELRFAAFFPDRLPPPRLAGLRAQDYPKAERSVMLRWEPSTDPDVALYRVHLATSTFTDITTAELDQHGVQTIDIDKIERINDVINSDCLLRIGQRCHYTLTNREFIPQPDIAYQLDDGMLLAFPLASDNTPFFLGITAVDSSGNEIDNVAQKIPIVQATSLDDLAPGPAKDFQMPIQNPDGSFSFNIWQPERNADGSAIRESELIAAVFQGCDAATASRIFSQRFPYDSGKLVGTTGMFLSNPLDCFSVVFEDDRNNPRQSDAEFLSLVFPARP